MRCARCNKFGHLKKCCNTITRGKARDMEKSNIKVVEEDDDDVQSLGLVAMATKKEEKKA